MCIRDSVTVRMLMNHTSGLPDEDWVIPFLEDKTRPIDNQKLLDVIMRLSLIHI